MAEITATQIIDALMAWAEDKVCASEVRFTEYGTRADFFTIEPIGGKCNFRTTAYEVKVSRQDFLRDTHEKQMPALHYSDRFFYVTPPGLIDKKDLPAWAGLVEWDGKSFAVKRKPPKRIKSPPDWRFIVDFIRSSVRVRRDTNLFTAQISALQQTLRVKERQAETAERWRREKWIRQMTTTKEGKEG